MKNKRNLLTEGRIPWNKGLKGVNKPNSGSFSKGMTPWNKGKKHSAIGGDKHPSWKGINVSYVALHAWVADNYGKPQECEACGTTTAKRFEWANISGDYTRDRSDWRRLCSTCHANEHKNWRYRKWRPINAY